MMISLFSPSFVQGFARLSLIVVGLIPLSLRSWFGRQAGLLAGMLPTRDQLITKAQLKAVLGPGAESIAPRVYSHLGEVLLESFDLSPLLNSLDTILSEEDRARIESYRSLDRPVVALTAHFGNWELLAALMVRCGVRLTVIGREARGSLPQAILSAVRERNGVQTVWRSSTRQGVRAIVQALQDGRTVAALIDQDTRVRGVSVPFFGRPAACPVSIIELAKRHHAKIVVALLAGSRGKYRFHLKELDSSLPSETIAAQYNAELEALIRAHPEQWVWVHKRWRTLPSGERLSGGDYLRYLANDMRI